MDVLTPAQRKRNMRAIKSTGTEMEEKLAKALWKKGYRYRKNNPKVFGKPDLTFKKHMVAVFVDSEFFHGKDWKIQKHRIKTNTDFWWKKIEGNIKRDALVNEVLGNERWKILRFWSKEVDKNLHKCIEQIESQFH